MKTQSKFVEAIQYWSVVMLLLIIALIFLIKYFFYWVSIVIVMVAATVVYEFVFTNEEKKCLRREFDMYLHYGSAQPHLGEYGEIKIPQKIGLRKLQDHRKDVQREENNSGHNAVD